MPGSKNITLYDVAQHCGVSYQTVSRVINEHPHVSTNTRQRVLTAIDELDYRPNRAAQSLVTRRSNMLEIITYGMQLYGPSQMVYSVERAARELGYKLIFSSIPQPTPDEIRAALNSMNGRLIDGIILITPVVDVDYDELVRLCRETPFIFIDTEPGSQLPSIMIDQGHGSQIATNHLIERGHRQICEISGPLRWCAGVTRHQGWQAALEAAGLTPGLSIESDWTASGGYQAAKELLNAGEQFTGLVVGNDQMALGALCALREAGLHVPDDVSVIGFDDIPEAAYFEPPLTTMRQDFVELGQQAVEYLVNRINRPDMLPHQRVLHPYLVERDSATTL
jgi:LacI family transcriptional regulator